MVTVVRGVAGYFIAGNSKSFTFGLGLVFALHIVALKSQRSDVLSMQPVR